MPSMEDLIEEAKASNQANNNRMSTDVNTFGAAKHGDYLMNAVDGYRNQRSVGSFGKLARNVGHKRHLSGSMQRMGSLSNRESVVESDRSSMMIRETLSVAESREHLSEAQQVRVVDNTRLSALTNQIMELVLDNIKMLHMNQKLVDYCKRQTIQSNQQIKLMEVQVETTTTTAEQSNEDMGQLQQELEDIRTKVSTTSAFRLVYRRIAMG